MNDKAYVKGAALGFGLGVLFGSMAFATGLFGAILVAMLVGVSCVLYHNHADTRDTVQEATAEFERLADEARSRREGYEAQIDALKAQSPPHES